MAGTTGPPAADSDRSATFGPKSGKAAARGPRRHETAAGRPVEPRTTLLLFAYFYDPTYGLFNDILRTVHLPTSQWVQSPGTTVPSMAMISVVIAATWMNVGGATLIYLAADLRRDRRRTWCSPPRRWPRCPRSSSSLSSSATFSPA
jgi:hypothetical protein